MKKIIIALFISVLFSGLLKAQDVYFGPKIGGNLSHTFYSGDSESVLNNSQMRLSSHFGVFTELVFSDFFSLQPELLYSIKGDEFLSNDDDTFKSSYIYKFLSLPVVMKYYVTEEITLEAGPQVAYLLSAKELRIGEDISTEYGEEEASFNLKEDDIVQVYDLGVVAGVGYLTKSGFYLSARYNLGLMNTYKEEGELKNGAIQLSAGFSFR